MDRSNIILDYEDSHCGYNYYKAQFVNSVTLGEFLEYVLSRKGDDGCITTESDILGGGIITYYYQGKYTEFDNQNTYLKYLLNKKILLKHIGIYSRTSKTATVDYTIKFLDKNIKQDIGFDIISEAINELSDYIKDGNTLAFSEALKNKVNKKLNTKTIIL